MNDMSLIGKYTVECFARAEDDSYSVSFFKLAWERHVTDALRNAR